MARQDGILPLKGTIDNITFYKSGDGYIAKRKTSIEPSRIAKDPAFQRTRENGAEFGRAGLAGKVLRNALRSLLQNASDRKMVGRLTKEMVKVVKADKTNARGLRNVIDGEAELLQGFDFNDGSKLSTTLFAPYTASINRVTGELTVTVPPFIPANMVAAPQGATHFRITSAGAEVDFENGVYVVQNHLTAELPWDGVATAAINLVNTVAANSVHPLFLVVGVDFFQEVNNALYPLKNGAFNSLAIVKVSGV